MTGSGRGMMAESARRPTRCLLTRLQSGEVLPLLLLQHWAPDEPGPRRPAGKSSAPRAEFPAAPPLTRADRRRLAPAPMLTRHAQMSGSATSAAARTSAAAALSPAPAAAAARTSAAAALSPAPAAAAAAAAVATTQQRRWRRRRRWRWTPGRRPAEGLPDLRLPRHVHERHLHQPAVPDQLPVEAAPRPGPVEAGPVEAGVRQPAATAAAAAPGQRQDLRRVQADRRAVLEQPGLQAERPLQGHSRLPYAYGKR